MPSKAVIDRQRIGESILAAARTHADHVAQRLHEVLSPFIPEGQSLPDLAVLQLVVANLLEDRLEKLVAADEAHFEELADDLDPRVRRDETAQILYDKLIQIRSTLNGAFGAERGDNLLGFNGPTPRDPRILHRQATRALNRLREPDPEFPSGSLHGFRFDRNALADELQPAVDDLSAALRDVTRELRETETTKAEKDEAIEAFDAAVGGTARMLTGFDQLVGLDSFAKKIRLTLPDRGGQQEDEPQPPGEELPREEGAIPGLPDLAVTDDTGDTP